MTSPFVEHNCLNPLNYADASQPCLTNGMSNFQYYLRELFGGPGVARQFLEAFAAESYRSHKLSRHQVGQLLGLDYWQTDECLTRQEAKRPYTLADLEIDRQSLATGKPH
jgi:hypothetical protein